VKTVWTAARGIDKEWVGSVAVRECAAVVTHPLGPEAPILTSDRPSRLETRTKESSALATVRVSSPCGERKRVHALHATRYSTAEHACWDPKGGELCLGRARPGETLVEARSGSDVQIDRRTWA
jgi:hypothetical protein